MALKRYGRLKTVEDLEPIFEDMQKLLREREELKALHGPVIVGLKKMWATAEKTLKRLVARRDHQYRRLEALVERFAQRKREYLLSLQHGKTVQVSDKGTIAFSFNPEHIEWEGKGDKDAEAAKAAALEDGGYERFVRVIKEIDVEALERDRETAERLGFRWERDEKITIKVKQ